MSKVELNVAGVPATEYNLFFMQGMVDRMGVSYRKYGAVGIGFPDQYDAISSLRDRLKKYAETGNKEFLMDAANFAMIEFMCPRHEKAHFRATDSNESPGRVNRETGLRDSKANRPEQEGTDNIRTDLSFSNPIIPSDKIQDGRTIS